MHLSITHVALSPPVELRTFPEVPICLLSMHFELRTRCSPRLCLQVHRAVMTIEGVRRVVAVKVRHPNVADIIRRDFQARPHSLTDPALWSTPAQSK